MLCFAENSKTRLLLIKKKKVNRYINKLLNLKGIDIVQLIQG